jgi:hypothetical protein
VAWKTVSLQVALVLGTALVALNFFCPSDTENFEMVQKSLAEQALKLENHVNSIESMLNGQPPGAPRSSGQSSQLPATIEEINKSLQASIDKLSLVESRFGNLSAKKINPSSTLPRTNLPPPPGLHVDPTAWIAELSETKRTQVEEIFKQNQEFFRKSILGGSPPNSERLKAIMEEGDQILKQKLRGVLDENEYQKFLDSLPKRPNVRPPPLPNAPK